MKKKSTFKVNAFAGNAFDYYSMSEMPAFLRLRRYLNNELDMGYLVVLFVYIYTIVVMLFHLQRPG